MFWNHLNLSLHKNEIKGSRQQRDDNVNFKV